jgi:NDP-sugar pyrophosphorylase family protein
MAGGEGKRLLPYTMVIPKPLLPLNGKSMIENVISKFQIYGFKSFIISINYKSNFLLSFFKNLSKNFKIKFIHEKKPLGTAGSLSMLNSKSAKNLFVVNCDSIISCDYLSFYGYHLENNYDMTIVVSKKKYVIPYGSCQVTSSGKLKKIIEKPDISYLANTGLYIFKSKILKLIPFEKEMNMNELIEIILRKKFKVGVFPVREEDWSDLGNWSDINNSSN